MTTSFNNDVLTQLKGKRFFPFIAPPNGGKGTQTNAMLAAFPNKLVRVDMGALLRAAAADPTNPLGEAIRERQAGGNLVELSIVMQVLAEGMAKLVAENPSMEGFLLDGFPRNAEQLAELDALCEQSGAVLAQGYFLQVANEAIIGRAAGRVFHKTTHQPYNLNNPSLQPPGYDPATFDLATSDYYQRDDDKPETVEKRLVSFYKDTQPVLDALLNRGLLTTVDGNQTPKAITPGLLASVQSLLLVAV